MLSLGRAIYAQFFGINIILQKFMVFVKIKNKKYSASSVFFRFSEFFDIGFMRKNFSACLTGPERQTEQTKQYARATANIKNQI